MNKRIERLLLQVAPRVGEDGEYLPSLHTPEVLEKFAQLIVAECVSLMEWQKISPKDDGAYNSALSLAQRNIKEQFGVEE